tara:strand:- start:1092 stop:1298 length:207 start_codon:yes stop_codon:yes gene_type:complete
MVGAKVLFHSIKSSKDEYIYSSDISLSDVFSQRSADAMITITSVSPIIWFCPIYDEPYGCIKDAGVGS